MGRRRVRSEEKAKAAGKMPEETKVVEEVVTETKVVEEKQLKVVKKKPPKKS